MVNKDLQYSSMQVKFYTVEFASEMFFLHFVSSVWHAETIKLTYLLTYCPLKGRKGLSSSRWSSRNPRHERRRRAPTPSSPAVADGSAVLATRRALSGWGWVPGVVASTMSLCPCPASESKPRPVGKSNRSIALVAQSARRPRRHRIDGRSSPPKTLLRQLLWALRASAPSLHACCRRKSWPRLPAAYINTRSHHHFKNLLLLIARRR